MPKPRWSGSSFLARTKTPRIPAAAAKSKHWMGQPRRPTARDCCIQVGPQLKTTCTRQTRQKARAWKGTRNLPETQNPGKSNRPHRQSLAIRQGTGPAQRSRPCGRIASCRNLRATISRESGPSKLILAGQRATVGATMWAGRWPDGVSGGLHPPYMGLLCARAGLKAVPPRPRIRAWLPACGARLRGGKTRWYPGLRPWAPRPPRAPRTPPG